MKDLTQLLTNYFCLLVRVSYLMKMRTILLVLVLCIRLFLTTTQRSWKNLLQ